MDNIVMQEVKANSNLAKQIQEEYLALFKEDPVKYKTKIDHYKPKVHQAAAITPNSDQIGYIVRNNQGNLVGYLKGEITPADENIPFVNAPGYKKYTGKGDSLIIDEIEVFEQRQGIGTQILNEMKRQGYELIELKTEDKNKQFYQKNGFVNTTLQDNRYDIFVWNNPKFQN